MVFGLIKIVVWIAGLGVLTYFFLPYFGYELNLDYFRESRERCEERLRACQRELIQGGLEGAKNRCEWKCTDPELLIKKSPREE